MVMLLNPIYFMIPPLLAAPISKQMVDMTYTFDESTQNWPGVKKFEMNAVQNGTHPIGFWLQIDEYSSSTHAGTHMDAPAHFVKGGITIEQIPLSSLIAPAAVVDITARAESNPDTGVTIEDLLGWESATCQSLNGTILLLRSGWGQKWNNRTAFFGITEKESEELHFPGLTEETAEWLVTKRNIKGIGTEALSFDLGINKGSPAHQIILGHGIFALENIANMDQLPINGAVLYVMPMKIGKASGAPTRVVAVFPNIISNRPHLKEQACRDKSVQSEKGTAHTFDWTDHN